jgi:N-acetylglucosamine kinase-like BadF-type ATPase
MILIADSGSTKTDWALVDRETVVRFNTQGINPVHQKREAILEILHVELLPSMEAGEVKSVFFYGSGMRPELEAAMADILREVFPQAKTVEAHSDLLGAARALCGHNYGIASILGTGANSCLYNGERIVMNTPAMGYVLGDEGSGAALGKRLLHDLYKGVLSEEIVSGFEAETGLSLPEIIDKVYRQPLPNRFLASLSEYVHGHMADWLELRRLVMDNFADFFRFNIAPYQRRDLSVSFVGSLAYHYHAELHEVARSMGYTVGAVTRSPIEGLVRYHTA